MSRPLRLITLTVGIAALILVGGAALTVAWMAHDSTPRAGAGGKIPGLSTRVRIEQDSLGIPTIRATSIEEVYRGQGWVTARDRLFQMDLLRRRSAGRLSEIFGKGALELDQFHRKMGFARVAEKAVGKMDEAKKRYLQAYADGVNAFLAQGPRSFEMRVLGYRPVPWRVEDSLLVLLAMFVDLDFATQYLSERSLTLLYAHRPAALADFLTPIAGFLDSPVLPDAQSVFPKIPNESVFDLRREPSESRAEPREKRPPSGSNGWALSGKFTTTGAPILAGDPHLDLFAPNIWYRVQLDAPSLRATGVSLPGLPGVILGTNGAIAWTITAPSADTLDLVKVSPSDSRTSRVEEIAVKGEAPQKLVVEEVSTGPIVFQRDDATYALQWTACDDTELAQIDTTSLLLAKSSAEFLSALSKWKGPASNVIFATRQGDIGWALVGSIPARVGFGGRIASERDGRHRWNGYLPFAELPRVLNPASGFIVSANQRMVPLKGDPRPVLKTGNNLSNPDRAHRIRQLLEKTRGKWTVESSYAIQLDIVSPTALFYRDTLEHALHQGSTDDVWAGAIGELVKGWDGSVSVDSAAFPFLRDFRRRLIGTLVEPLWGCPSLDEKWIGADQAPVSEWYYVEPVMAALVAGKPAHLLSAQFKSYDEAIIQTAVASAQSLVKRPEDLKLLRWGDINRTWIPHPFSVALPSFLGRYLRMPDEPVSGTFSTPKVASLLYGKFHSASMRMVIDLSDPSRSIFNQPGGQSGHFPSGNYADQFRSWLDGKPEPFVAGKTVVVDELVPGTASGEK